MNLGPSDIAMLAQRVDDAALNRREITKITNEFPKMDWEDAYAIQEALKGRVEARGQDCSLLFKAGLTSRATGRTLTAAHLPSGSVGSVRPGTEIMAMPTMSLPGLRSP